MRKPLELVLYSKEECPLCDEMKEAVAEASRHLPLTLRPVDITADPRLQREYGLDIPLLFLDGSCVAKHRVTAAELVEKLKRRMGAR